MTRSPIETKWSRLRDWLVLRGFRIDEPSTFPNLAYVIAPSDASYRHPVYLEAPDPWLRLSVVVELLADLGVRAADFTET